MERYYAFFNTLKKHELEIDSHASILKDTDTILRILRKSKNCSIP